LAPDALLHEGHEAREVSERQVRIQHPHQAACEGLEHSIGQQLLGCSQLLRHCAPPEEPQRPPKSGRRRVQLNYNQWTNNSGEKKLKQADGKLSNAQQTKKKRA